MISCPICQDFITLSSEPYVTSCGHLYHKNCILQWCKDRNNCPQCRCRLSSPPFRVYFTQDETPKRGYSVVSAENLIEQLEVSDIKLEEAQQRIKMLENEVKELNTANSDLSKQHNELRQTTTAYKAQLKDYVEQKKELITCKSQLAGIQEKIQSYERIEKLMNDNSKEALVKLKTMTRSYSAWVELCTLVEIYKKASEEAINKQKRENRLLHKTKSDYAMMEHKYKLLQERIDLLESQNKENDSNVQAVNNLLPMPLIPEAIASPTDLVVDLTNLEDSIVEIRPEPLAVKKKTLLTKKPISKSNSKTYDGMGGTSSSVFESSFPAKSLMRRASVRKVESIKSQDISSYCIIHKKPKRN